MIRLRALVFNLVFFLGTAIAIVGVGIPCLVLPRRCLMTATKNWARAVLAALRGIVGLDFEIRGRRDLLARPGLFAVKHQSAWDTFVFFALMPDVAYVLKRELMWIPIYGWLARKNRMIAVDRRGGGQAIRGLMREAKAALAQGRQIVIFPQGTRVAPHATAPYQPGIAALYARLDVPVVPVALNSGRFWGRRSFTKHAGTIVIEVLDPIAPGLDRAAFMRELETRIERASARLT